MSRRIIVDPAKLEMASQKMDEQAADYERLYRQLYTEVRGMGAAWQGQDNNAFIKQINEFEDDFERMAQLMRSYAQFLRDSAGLYRQAQTDTINNAYRLPG